VTNRRKPDLSKRLNEFVTRVEDVVIKNHPSAHEENLALVKKMELRDPLRRHGEGSFDDGTATALSFTAALMHSARCKHDVPHKNVRRVARVHKDDKSEGWRVLTVMKRGGVAGGHLVCPALKVAFDMDDGDVLIFRSDIIYHGVTDVYGIDRRFTDWWENTRISFSCYIDGCHLNNNLRKNERVDPNDPWDLADADEDLGE
jgi:hypothetical protein